MQSVEKKKKTIPQDFVERLRAQDPHAAEILIDYMNGSTDVLVNADPDSLTPQAALILAFDHGEENGARTQDLVNALRAFKF